ncbi:MAG: thioredoxin family protein [Candidatus Sumerlaeia bacterium]|nr:thioredoxin family protein [Candidatus Sumerlaeia bacterium]
MSRLLQSVVILCGVLVGIPSELRGDWSSAGTLNIPPHPYSFLAATPDGNLLAATFNSEPAGGRTRNLPALLIRNPMSNNPEVVELSRMSFEPLRGYGGIASDSSGAYYVSADTGSGETSFVCRFLSDGSLDRSFASGGFLRVNRRLQGIDIIGDYLLIAVEWGEIMVCDANTGMMINRLMPGRAATSPVYVRDIAVDPKSLRVFGVSQGGLVTWGGGMPWRPNSYTFRQLTPFERQPRAGEGVSVDPIKRTVLFTHSPGNNLLEVHGSGRVETYNVPTAQSDAQLSDSILSFDGSTLFISDLEGRKVHVMRRDVDAVIKRMDAQLEAAQARASTGSGATITESAPAPTWHRSYTDAMEKARNENRPMIIYFRSEQIPRCKEVEEKILLTNGFNSRVDRAICVFENVDQDRLLAYRFGVYRVPHIVFLDPRGGTIAEYRYDIDSEQVFTAMESLSSLGGGQ